jgi:hypothetical protein
MLHGVLNMPPNLWCDSPIDIAQRHSRYKQASQRIEQLERELAAANQIMGELCESCGWAMRFPDQPCRCELERELAEARKERDMLAKAMIPAMTRAYARGYNHGHEDTVESTFMTTHASDELTFFADDIRQMLLDGSQPEAQAALAAVKGSTL